MGLFGILSFLMVLFLPEAAFACPSHALAADSPALRSPTAVFFNMVVLLIVSTPLGFVAGRIAGRLSAAGRTAALLLVTAGLLTAGTHGAWACHGARSVEPALKEVYAAQHAHRAKHGAYGASFQKLGMRPSSTAYSYFLPSETLSAEHPFPRDGVDLRRLPEGVVSVASADAFTVVAIAFAEPNRIDVWTMDQNKDFREWSVSAFPKVEGKPEKGEPTRPQGVFGQLLNPFEVPLTLMMILLGLGIGFTLAMRTSVMARPASA